MKIQAMSPTRNPSADDSLILPGDAKLVQTEPKMLAKLRENLKTRRHEFRESMRGIGLRGGVL